MSDQKLTLDDILYSKILQKHDNDYHFWKSQTCLQTRRPKAYCCKIYIESSATMPYNV